MEKIIQKSTKNKRLFIVEKSLTDNSKVFAVKIGDSKYQYGGVTVEATDKAHAEKIFDVLETSVDITTW